VCDMRDKEEIKMYLKDANIDVTRSDATGLSLIHLVAQKGVTKEVVEVLLEAGANPNEQLMNGATPLMIAAERGHADVLRGLTGPASTLEYKDTMQRNFFGMGSTPLLHACRMNHTNCAMVLLQVGVNVNTVNNNAGLGISDGGPIHWAASHGNEEIVKALIAHEADINAPSKDGPPLHWAIRRKHMNMAKLLLSCGAAVQLEFKDRKNKTIVETDKPACRELGMM
jgi:ankyrin repeat protein